MIWADLQIIIWWLVLMLQCDMRKLCKLACHPLKQNFVMNPHDEDEDNFKSAKIL